MARVLGSYTILVDNGEVLHAANLKKWEREKPTQEQWVGECCAQSLYHVYPFPVPCSTLSLYHAAPCSARQKETLVLVKCLEEAATTRELKERKDKWSLRNKRPKETKARRVDLARLSRPPHEEARENESFILTRIVPQ